MKGNSSNFITLDIGSSKISAIAAHVSKQGEIRINAQVLQHSEGFKSGTITNMGMAESSLIGAIYSLEKDCDKSIKEIAISLSGAGIKSYYVNHNIKLGNQPITQFDVKKLVNKALSDFKVKGMEIIHYFPIEFMVDSNQAVESPIGLYAKELSCQLHIISADSTMIMNLTKCIAKCHVEVSDIIVSIYAAGLAVLTDDEKQLGSIIIDFGANTTSYGIFLEGKIVYVNHIPIGGMDITIDIAKNLSISLKEAEKLKILYGVADPGLLLKDSVIKLDNGEHTITASQLAKIINPKIKEITEEIKKQYDSMSMDHLLARQVVITGGGASLASIRTLVAEIFHKQVRIAKPEIIPGFVENYNSYIHSTAIGMVKYKSLKNQKNSYGTDQFEDSGWFKRTILWLKENI
ncbi:Cell division protein FtsA [Candidatus Megaera venefica]|uniref:Cell division protein FtsA n=1 Tax=Candidatus Megaera venefica TaxID=2055910 RepID=A0ABU5NEI2_9RICK|nr:cell division protein FtsA [Candidatus Megaera venefica]MEA0971593.1 Cell division protein FtsA [Candidatus Megaera venefica]